MDLIMNEPTSDKGRSGLNSDNLLTEPITQESLSVELIDDTEIKFIATLESLRLRYIRTTILVDKNSRKLSRLQ